VTWQYFFSISINIAILLFLRIACGSLLQYILIHIFATLNNAILFLDTVSHNMRFCCDLTELLFYLFRYFLYLSTVIYVQCSRSQP